MPATRTGSGRPSLTFMSLYTWRARAPRNIVADVHPQIVLPVDHVRNHTHMRLRAILIAPCLLAVATLAYAQDWPMYLGDLSHDSSRPGETTIYPGNAAQLRQLWKTTVAATVSSGTTVSGGSLYFGDWSGGFYSLNALTGAARWNQYLGMAPDPADPSCQPIAPCLLASATLAYAQDWPM